MASALARLPVWLLAALILVVCVAPLAQTINTALYAETAYGLSASRSLAAVIIVYTTSEYLGALADALMLSVIVTSVSLSLGVTMAFIMARARLRLAAVLDILIISPMFLSPFTGLIAWIVLASEQTGFLNMAWRGLAGNGDPLFNIWSYAGVVWVMVLFFTPFAYLFTVNPLRAMDASLEEAARTAGASPLRSILRITLPMMVPAIFGAGLLIFVLAAEMYTIPGIIGATAGFTTLPYQIYLDTTVSPVHLARAAAGGTILLWVTLAGILLQRRVTRRSERYVTIGGKGHRSRPIDLGRWKWAAYGLTWGYIACAVLLPMVALIVYSLMKYSSGRLGADVFSLVQYRNLFSLQSTREALGNTLLLGILSGTICAGLGTVISFLELRTKGWLIIAVAFLAVLPIAVPGLVYGIGLSRTYLRTPLYGTIWVLLLAYIAKFLPYAIVVSRSGIMQIGRELEESARTCGASPTKVLARITLPLLKPTLVSVLFFVMLMSIKELSASVLLYSERGPILSVLIWSYMDSGNFQFAAAIGVIQSVIMVGLVLFTRLIFRVRIERAAAH